MKQRLSDYIREELLDGRIYRDLKEDDDLLTTGLVDSLGMMSLVTFIEDEFGIRVPPEDVTPRKLQHHRCHCELSGDPPSRQMTDRSSRPFRLVLRRGAPGGRTALSALALETMSGRDQC